MMILQLSRLVVDCPICGRPVEMQPQYVSHEIACGHCRGEFIVYEKDNGSLTAAKLIGMDSLERADQLLRGVGRIDATASVRRCQRLFKLLSMLGEEERPDESDVASLADARRDGESQPTVLLVEPRDEVFARIATDIAEFGMCVVRAKSGTEALKLCGTYEPTLVVANLDLPDQSGWLLAAKLRFVDRRIRVWLYQPQSGDYDHAMADFLKVDALLDYQGDLLGLSETIVDLMANRREPHDAVCDIERSEEPAAA